MSDTWRHARVRCALREVATTPSFERLVSLVLSGNWAAALSGAIFVQLGRIAAMLIERRRSMSAEL